MTWDLTPEVEILYEHVLMCVKVHDGVAGVERLAFSVTWDLTPEGRILSQWAGRSIIKSCVKLAYGHAQEMIEGSFAGLPDQATPTVQLFGYDWSEVSVKLRRFIYGAGTNDYMPQFWAICPVKLTQGIQLHVQCSNAQGFDVGLRSFRVQ